MIIARCRDPETVAWARGFFRKLYRWTIRRFPLSRHLSLAMTEGKASSSCSSSSSGDNESKRNKSSSSTNSTSSGGGGGGGGAGGAGDCGEEKLVPCPLWLVGGDRKATFAEEYSFGTAGLRSRKENYHHPRFLLMACQLVDEIVAAGEGSSERASE